ncbi:armadillo-type protein [Crassisporium funariophilum]|nr:armadillo-type protein [Crassisporium funariophilum]
MDVPFHSSGAMSRAHFSIVRKVESASSTASADQDLFLQIYSIQEQLAHPKLRQDQCKECLILLLYCSMSVTSGFLARDAFDFAFPHAINLAEAGKKIDDKRMGEWNAFPDWLCTANTLTAGYLFCSERMPLDHDLRLMLVNTLRKDLESDEVPRICLALDNLIASPSEDVIPAVQSRLHDLLSHEYSHIRHQALLAFRALSHHNPALVTRIYGTVVNRLRDSDELVVQAALLVAAEVFKDDTMKVKIRDIINDIFQTESSYIGGPNHGLLLKILTSLRTVGSPKAHSRLQVIVLEAFRLLAQLDVAKLLSVEKGRKISPIRCIRHLLLSQVPNHLHLFMSCLECVNVASWAGTESDYPAVLESEEFGRIMQLMDSPDHGVRRKTLNIVNSIDPAILDAQIKHITSSLEVASKDRSKLIMQILEILLIRHEQDGEQYASQILLLIQHLEQGDPSKVIQRVVEAVLTDIHATSNTAFRVASVTRFINDLVDPNVTIGPTELVIISALATEFSNSVPIVPTQILSGLAARLKTCLPIVQETCVIAMLRVRADCGEVSQDVWDAVTTTSRTARRSVQLRCEQFLELSRNRDMLLDIVHESSSSSLPDFLLSLHSHTPEGSNRSSAVSTPEPSRVRVSSKGARSTSALKYTAYDPPDVVPRQRTRRQSSSQPSVSSTRSALSNPGLTAGDLALATGLRELTIGTSDPTAFVTGESKREADLQVRTASRVDLITLDSPFQSDLPPDSELPSMSQDISDFEDIWNSFGPSCDLRGWSSASIDSVTRRLQRMDGNRLAVISAELPPFMGNLAGELKIMVSSSESSTNAFQSHSTLLRLRESDEDSCLWRLRCEDSGVRARIQNLLTSNQE